MKILITGASGFLGKVIYRSLGRNEIQRLGRSEKSEIRCDFSEEVPVLPDFNLVIHCAGLAHRVPKTQRESRAFFNVNVQGTKNLLDALEKSPFLPKFFVFISSVAVYGKQEGELINEEQPLLGIDPYGLSKIQAEKIVYDWCEKHKIICTIFRLPLVAGPNPPGNLNAMIKGIKNGYYFNIISGKARKSIVLAEDVARIIPEASKIGGIYNLTDSYHPTFLELSVNIADQLSRSRPLTIPYTLAKLMAILGDLIGDRSPINSDKLRKIVSNLTFDDSKARKLLGWNPTLVLKGFKIK